MKITSVNVFSKVSGLKKPYVLSFVSLSSLKSNFVEIELENGSRGLGEATALPGYGSETFDEIEEFLCMAKDRLSGQTEDQALEYLRAQYPSHPFGVSAVGTALDFASKKVHVPETMSIPLLYAVSSGTDIAKFNSEILKAVDNGFKTIKVKIGRDIDLDLRVMREIVRLPSEIRFRFDANQAYSVDQTRRFLDLAREILSDGLDYLEQPVPKENWKDIRMLCREFPDQILLDESIYDERDIQKASRCGVRFIKLKLFKTRGVVHLNEIARYAREMEMRVVLGNGVATDVCNFAEAIAYSSEGAMYHGAFEGNGFARIDEPVRHNSIQVQDGKLIWPGEQDAEFERYESIRT